MPEGETVGWNKGSWESQPWPYLGRWNDPFRLKKWRDREHKRVYDHLEKQRAWHAAQEPKLEALRQAK